MAFYVIKNKLTELYWERTKNVWFGHRYQLSIYQSKVEAKKTASRLNNNALTVANQIRARFVR